ncbi:LysR family transcriptional regulator [Lactobacillus sp. CBA3605]|uniref:LysR family transcriptional regulator n=1 Tax=Lactobacillus sp. CBA3605 TaxID=2099788 RepID=UPI00351A15C1
MAVNLNQFMIQANQPTITFSELKNLSFVVLTDIGPWQSIIQHAIPHAKFFYQAERDALTEITKYSDFPYFTTNITAFDAPVTNPTNTDSRVCLPISDASAQMPIYANFLQSEQQRVISIIDQLITTLSAI